MRRRIVTGHLAGTCVAVALVLPLLLAAPADAQDRPAGVTARPVSATALPNIPGKSLKTVEVTYAPGAASGSHTHARSAFIYAHVIEGEVRSKVDQEPERVYRAGEFWTERPGAHHVVSANASDSKPARLLAVFVVDTDDMPLTTPDKK